MPTELYFVQANAEGLKQMLPVRKFSGILSIFLAVTVRTINFEITYNSWEKYGS